MTGPPTHIQAHLHAQELVLKRAADDPGKLTRALVEARVDLNPHQVDAALFAFKNPLSKGAILADEVGLGKTIEAGLVATQHWPRAAGESLVLCPASLRTQWRDELQEKFLLPSVILDSRKNIGKSPYSHVEWESSIEERFAKRLDGDARVRFFVKLPSWFTVDTPVGPYNPDWAICWEDDDRPRLHLVRETKSTHEEIERRGVENAKIACARKDFEAIGAGYAVATSFYDLVSQMG